jgi:hypothetical protein
VGCPLWGEVVHDIHVGGKNFLTVSGQEIAYKKLINFTKPAQLWYLGRFLHNIKCTWENQTETTLRKAEVFWSDYILYGT